MTPDKTHNPTFYETIVHSPQWKAWVKRNEEDPQWDVHESIECGWLSEGHFQAFLTQHHQDLIDEIVLRLEGMKGSIICPECNGDGWVCGSRAVHGCDGTYEMCAQMCPVEEQTQEGCDFCRGEGKLEAESEKNGTLTEAQTIIKTLTKE